MKILEIRFDLIDSTQTYAKKHGLSFDKDGVTCVTAEEQTAGIGQFQKKWISPKGVNLYATFYFRLPALTQNITTLALLMAKTIKTVLEKNGLAPNLKWPNDVLLNQKKIAGALCETIFHPGFIEILLGFGLNVNMEERDLLQIDQPATSLKNETCQFWDKERLLKEIQDQFLTDIEEFRQNNCR